MTNKTLAGSATCFKSFYGYCRSQAQGAVEILLKFDPGRVVEVPRSGGVYFIDLHYYASARKVARGQTTERKAR